MTNKQLQIKMGARIKEVRQQRNISQETLAQSIEKDVSYINQLESGIIDPNLAILCVLIENLQLPLSEFFSDFD